MVDPWLTIIGIGEDGLSGLPDASRQALDRAEIVFGGPRHLELAGVADRGAPWPVPFDIAPVLACRGQRVVVLTSGDPFWFGAGGTLASQLPPEEWQALPVAGCFSLAAARLGWRLEDTTCLGLHAAPFENLRSHLHRECRIIATMRDGKAVRDLVAWLLLQGLDDMRITVMERLGGALERVRSTCAKDFPITDIQAPVAVALDGSHLPRATGLPVTPGLPETGFAHDGQITKSPIRALTLAALAPRKGELLWDIGAGSGSISVEWALAGGYARAIEARADRIGNIRRNITDFGLTDRVEVIHGRTPEALHGLPQPDAVFVGGGASEDLFAILWPMLPGGARLVANAVTLETEALLSSLHTRHGGRLMRFDIAEAAPLGTKTGWQALRPVTQWQVTR